MTSADAGGRCWPCPRDRAILGFEDLAARSIATVEVGRELKLVPLHGDYSLWQSWSRALWKHNDPPDGLIYRSRHDDSSLCIALYDRAAESLNVVTDRSLTNDSGLLARLLKRYDLALTR